MPVRRALRIARNETTGQIVITKVAFRWEDVFMLEDDTGSAVAYHKPLTWVCTEMESFYIEGDFETVAAEWDAHEAVTDNRLLFSRH